MKFKFLFLVFVFFVSGCATQGINSMKYTPSAETKVLNEATVKKPYSQVWDGLVKELSKSFYVINNIDKESRIINLSFSTTSPSQYVDCGKTHRTYKQGEKIEEFNYDVAESTRFKVATDRQEAPAFANFIIINREPSLEGRANIYIAPDEKDSSNTTITVNTRYIVSTKIRGEVFAEHISGNVFSRGRTPDENTTVSFNTNQIGELVVGNGDKLTCVSKGKLEAEILEMAKK